MHMSLMNTGSITRVLREIRDGHFGSRHKLFQRVYAELKLIATAQMHQERRAPQLMAAGSSDLVHEAYLRLGDKQFANRRHLFFVYARAMRQILIERARRKRHKLGSLDAECAILRVRTNASSRSFDALDVNELLCQLRKTAPHEYDVVLLRFYGGLHERAIAEVLGVDARTVRRYWVNARTRLAAWAMSSSDAPKGDAEQSGASDVIE